MICDYIEGWDVGVDGREVQEEGDICILTADPHCSTVETNITL